METRWSIQHDLAEHLLEQHKLCAAARLAGDAEKTDEPRASLEELESKLRALQAELATTQASKRLVNFEICPRLITKMINH